MAMLIPAVLAIFIVANSASTIAGPPKDGLGYTISEHFGIFLACLSVSFIASWAIIPFAVLALRAAAMLGWAGWASAAISAVVIGLPIVHFALNGDVTTESQLILPHIIAAIAFLGLSVWAAFWGLMALRRSSTQADTP